MDKSRIARKALLAALATSTVSAHAALIDQGNRTLDTATNLLWLDMTASVGLSAKSILDGADPNRLMASGWSHASVGQIETLLMSAGMIGPFNGQLRPTDYAAAATLLSLLGVTGGSIQAFSSTSPEAGKFNTPSLLAFPSVGGADLPGPAVFETSFNPLMGSWLVQAVPEPETFAMMLVGLGLVGWARVRRRCSHTY